MHIPRADRAAVSRTKSEKTDLLVIYERMNNFFVCMEGYTIVGKIYEWFSFVWEVGCLLSINVALNIIYLYTYLFSKNLELEEVCNQKTNGDYFMNFWFIFFPQTC